MSRVVTQPLKFLHKDLFHSLPVFHRLAGYKTLEFAQEHSP